MKREDTSHRLSQGASALGVLSKLTRYIRIYGPGRALTKALGRLRVSLPFPGVRHRVPDVAVIGCGQFAFSTIAYFLQKDFGPRITACYDIDTRACNSLARAFRVRTVSGSVEELFATTGLRTVYIASNHASHALYAVQALAKNLNVYVEKPIAVNHTQLADLLRAQRTSRGQLFSGYNRPFSAAIRDLRRELRIAPTEGISMQCFVAGHRLSPDHWYRRPEEGTRVCGNIGHWLDLMVHVFAWRGLPDRLDVSIAYSDPAETDDNLSISITSDRKDLFSVMLTSRSEPFEGINETIHIQHSETTCKIDDFRRLTLWRGPRLLRRRYWPKDVGHKLAILQPFTVDSARDWHEVELSTLLMLHIADMVRSGQRHSTFSFEESWEHLLRRMESR